MYSTYGRWLLIEWSASKNKSRSGETFQKSHRNLACSFVGGCSHVSRSPFQHGESHSPRPNVVVDVVLYERLFIQLNDDTIMKKKNNNIKRQHKKYKRTDATTCLQTRLYSIAYSELCLRIILSLSLLDVLNVWKMTAYRVVSIQK